MAEDTNNIINGFELVNKDKLNRAIYGSIGEKGALYGGVGEGASPEAIVAEYDRLGGLIKKGKYQVKMGSFYDFLSRKVRANPVVIYQFRMNGKIVEIPADEEVPLEIRASEIQREREVKENLERVEAEEQKKEEKKAKRKKKSIDEDGDSE